MNAGKFVTGLIIAYALLVLVAYFATGVATLKYTEPLILAALVVIINIYGYHDKKRYIAFLSALLALFCSVFIITSSTIHVMGMEANKYIAFSVGLVCICLVIITYINEFKKIRYPVSFSIFLLVYLPILILWNYYLTFNVCFSADSLLAILQTNSGEAWEYLQMSLSLKNYLVSGVFIALLVGLAGATKPTYQIKRDKASLGMLALLVIINIFLVCKYQDNIVLNICSDAQTALKEYRTFESNSARRKINAMTVDGISGGAKGIYVLVIGESQNKEHMSAYSYNRDTTPWLQDMQQNNNFLLFQDAYSCHTHTVQALSYALTAKNQYNNILLPEAVSLPEVAKAARYDTVWLSNQIKYGVYDTPITTIAGSSNQQYWANKNYSVTYETKFHDLKLLEGLNGIKITDKMLIVIHLMGNHFNYKERYPEEFKRYLKDNDLDSYDNSMLYNDFVVKNIYEQVKKLPNFQALVYFADHSEDVKGKLRHTSDNFIFAMARIPMYMYFSDEYVQAYPEIIDNLKKARTNTFTNDLIFNCMMGVMRINSPSLYEAHNDITSSAYDARRSRFKTLLGKKEIADDY